MDLECEDARRQLLNVQAMHLCQLGYNKEQALKALRLTINSVTHTASIEVVCVVCKLVGLLQVQICPSVDLFYFIGLSKNVLLTGLLNSKDIMYI